MKKTTEKTNTADGGKINGKRNFFQKTLILFLIFIGFGFEVKSQSYALYFEYDNTSTCDWDVTFYDISLNLLHNYTVLASSSGVSTCAIGTTATVAYITLVETGGSCTYNLGTCSTGCILANVISNCGYSCGGASPTDRILVGQITACGPSPPQQAFSLNFLP